MTSLKITAFDEVTRVAQLVIDGGRPVSLVIPPRLESADAIISFCLRYAEPRSKVLDLLNVELVK